MQFEATKAARRKVPHVLRVASPPGTATKYLRLTHDFGNSFYGTWVTDAASVRTAGRPRHFTVDDLNALEVAGGQWGRLTLPDDLAGPLPKPDPTTGAWRVIEPLIQTFESERSLRSGKFTHFIDERAKKLKINSLTVRRLIYRYYYFGQLREGLRSLPPGRTPKEPSELAEPGNSASEPVSPGKRTGRKASVSEKHGENTFKPGPEDIADMVSRLARMALERRTYVTDAHEAYLKFEFKERHPKTFALYAKGKHPEPVSLRQYRRYTNEYMWMSKDIAENLRTNRAGRSGSGSLDAVGPGDIYEVDATGGRIVLTTSGDKRNIIAQPTIYIIIDRWSRYIVSIYVSLNAPAWDEVKYALLVAFTSRNERFKGLNVDIDDGRWPVGRMCNVLRRDRGSDMISGSMDQVVSGDLHIDPSTLPAYTPNGKAIVERVIRTLKQWMAKNVKGTYAERPLTPKRKKAAKIAKRYVIHSLAELYRKLIQFVEEYNNRPHSRLKKMAVLAQAGVPPTPQAAYLWGVENITGMRLSSFSDEQLKKMMLGIDDASIAEGEVLYRSRRYRPHNKAARNLAAKMPSKRTKIKVRVDKTFPTEIYVHSRTDWPKFVMVDADRRALGLATIDEFEALKPRINATERDIKHDQTRARVTGVKAVPPAVPTVDRSTPTRAQLEADRKHESASLKAILTAQQEPKKSAAKPAAKKANAVPGWVTRAEAVRAADFAKIKTQYEKSQK